MPLTDEQWDDLTERAAASNDEDCDYEGEDLAARRQAQLAEDDRP